MIINVSAAILTHTQAQIPCLHQWITKLLPSFNLSKVWCGSSSLRLAELFWSARLEILPNSCWLAQQAAELASKSPLLPSGRWVHRQEPQVGSGAKDCLSTGSNGGRQDADAGSPSWMAWTVGPTRRIKESFRFGERCAKATGSGAGKVAAKIQAVTTQVRKLQPSNLATRSE